MILERERVPSLYISRRSERRFSTEQEAKSIYAARAMRGHRFGGVSTTPKEAGIFSYLVYSFAKSHFMDRDLLSLEGP